MTSTNPAFVKAFARRSRPRAQAVQPRPVSETNATIPMVQDPAEHELVTRVDRPVVDEAPVAENSVASEPSPIVQDVTALDQSVVVDQLGSLYQDQAIVQSTHVWVDTVNDRFARADQPTDRPPSPHVEIRTPQPNHPEIVDPQPTDPEPFQPAPIESAPIESAAEVSVAPETPAITPIAMDEIGVNSAQDTVPETPSAPGVPTEPPVTHPESEAAAGFADSMQHIHTAYAAAPVDFDLAQLATASSSELAVEEASASTQNDAALNGSALNGSAQNGSAQNHAALNHAAINHASVIETTEVTEPPEPFEADPAATPQPLETPPAIDETPETDSSVKEVASPYAGIEQRVDSPQVQPPKSHTTTPLVPFQPVWEVDVFDIPRVVADLFFDGELFQQIAERMGEAVNTGLNSVLITSAQPGEGRSSIAIGIAMAAAAAGIRVALVDADTEKPTLAEDLRLDLQYGWVDTIRGGLPISEVAVHAVEDGVTLIPLMQPNGPTAGTAQEVAQLLAALRDRFELVVIDGPAEMSQSVLAFADSVDTAIVVRDTARTDARMINEYSYRLREAGIQGVGIVENFV